MRTMSSTLRTREEAETVSRRLQAIGVGPDRILLKDLSDEGHGIFISAKVTPDQVREAGEILKAPPPEEIAPPAMPDRGTEAPASHVPIHHTAERPRIEEDRGAFEAPRRSAPAAGVDADRPPIIGRAGPANHAPHPAVEDHQRRPARAAGRDGPQLSRMIVIFGLIILVGFALGALLGQIG